MCHLPITKISPPLGLNQLVLRWYQQAVIPIHHLSLRLNFIHFHCHPLNLNLIMPHFEWYQQAKRVKMSGQRALTGKIGGCLVPFEAPSMQR